MRGYPIWQVICVVLMFAAAGAPVWGLTRPGRQLAPEAAEAVPAPSVSATQKLGVEINFVPAPADFKLSYLGSQTVLAGQGPMADFNGEWNAKLPADAADLILQVTWPAGARAHVAARVTVRSPGGQQVAATFFGDASERMVEPLTAGPENAGSVITN